MSSTVSKVGFTRGLKTPDNNLALSEVLCMKFENEIFLLQIKLTERRPKISIYRTIEFSFFLLMFSTLYVCTDDRHTTST